MSGVPVSPPPPPVAPQPSGPSAGRLVAIVVGVIFGIALLAMVGLGVVSYIIASKVHITTLQDDRGREKTFRVETPFGRLRVDRGEQVDPKLLNIPIYPGATAVGGGYRDARVDLDLDFADKYLRVVTVEMETLDPAEKVIAFYREHAPDFVFREKHGKAEFTWRQGEFRKAVGIRERHGKTLISLANVGEPEAN